jgi:5'-nucleotidase (lipoprotein e(P4) family)
MQNRIIMRKLILFIIIITLVSGCATDKTEKQLNNNEPLLLSVLWYQKSAEMKAIYLQSYNIAGMSLEQKLSGRKSSKPAAVILDIDETVLDNSPVEVAQISGNLPFSDSLWLSWVVREEAGVLPGAAEFLNFAKSKGVEIFYVTNREYPQEFQPTLNNLKKHNLPFADSTHLLLKTDESSKGKRRAAIAEKYDVLMLIGDNLADLASDFDSRKEDLGFGAVDSNRQKFGVDFIVLPNPMYGPWINAALEGSEGSNKRERIMKVLRGY